MNRKKKRTLCLCLAVFLALAGGLSLGRSRVLLLNGGATELRTEHLPGGARVREYCPECVLGESAPGVLILSRSGDGSRLVASELARRGTTVLLARERDAAEAWEHLASRSYVRRSSMGLMACGRDAETALALTESLAGSGKLPGALVLCGDAALAERATETVRNLLIFTRSADTVGETEGYFAEGTARRVSDSGASWYKKDVQTELVDWLGSSLGHYIELADDDMRCGTAAVWIAAAGLCLAAAVCLSIRADRVRDHAHRRRPRTEQTEKHTED